MKKSSILTIDECLTSHGMEYRIVSQRTGTIYAVTYDPAAAAICLRALSTNYSTPAEAL